MRVLRTKFIYDHNDQAIGRVDDEGNIYTLQGNPSSVYVPTARGTQVSGAHIRRERAARNMLAALDDKD